MLSKKVILIGLSLSVASLIVSGCGSSSSSEDSTNKIKAVIVDPYIKDAILCEDKNKDGMCNSGELLSSASNENGEFEFDNNLTAGSNIIIKKQGIHEGVEYDLNISAVVNSEGKIDVVSPLSTFQTKGLTTDQIAELLNKAAQDSNILNWSISKDDINTDPLSDDLLNKTVDNLSDADLVKIQASLASYGILKIMSGSDVLSSLSPEALYFSATSSNGEVQAIAKTMLNGIVSVLNKTLLNSITQSIIAGRNAVVSGGVDEATAKNALVSPSADLLIKTAVVIIDRLAEIGYTKCNQTDGDVSQALASVGDNILTITSQAVNLGTTFYGLIYHDNLKTNFAGFYSAALDGVFAAQPDIKKGFQAQEDGVKTFRFNDANEIVEIK